MGPGQIFGLMKVQGVTAAEAVEELGVHRDTVYRAIRGERAGPDAERVLEWVAEKLGLTVEDLREERSVRWNLKGGKRGTK